MKNSYFSLFTLKLLLQLFWKCTNTPTELFLTNMCLVIVYTVKRFHAHTYIHTHTMRFTLSVMLRGLELKGWVGGVVWCGVCVLCVHVLVCVFVCVCVQGKWWRCCTYLYTDELNRTLLIPPPPPLFQLVWCTKERSNRARAEKKRTPGGRSALLFLLSVCPRCCLCSLSLAVFSHTHTLSKILIWILSLPLHSTSFSH